MTLPPDASDPEPVEPEPVDRVDAEVVEPDEVVAGDEVGSEAVADDGADVGEPPATKASAAKTSGSHWPRRIATGVLVALAATLFIVSSVAVWAKRTVLDTDRVAAAVDAAASDEVVVDALATRLTTQIMTLIDNSGVIQDVLPDSLQRLTPVIETAIQNAVNDQVTNLLDSDTGRELLVDAARIAHRTALKILEGEGLPDDSIFVVGNGVVKLDLVTLVTRIIDRLQQQGIISDRFDLQAVAESVTSNEKVQALATTFNVQLPDDFGQLTVIDTGNVDGADEALASAQRALQVFQRLTVLLVILAVVFIVAALLVSVDKRRTAAQLAFVIGVLALVVRFAVNRVIDGLGSAIDKAGARAAAVEITESLTSTLQRSALVIAICAFLIAGIAFAIRPRESGEPWLVTMVQRSPDIARVVVVGFCLLLLAVLGLSGAALVVTVGLVIAGMLAVSALTKRPSTALG